MEHQENQFFVDSEFLSPQALEKKHRLETDPTLSALIPPARQRSMSPQLEAQHQKIYEAIRDHKSEHAYFYMKEHLEFVLESYQEYFAMFY